MRKEGKKKERRRSNMKGIPKIALFGHIYFKKISISNVWCIVTSLGPRSVYT
jgi:hypothetical protein